MTQGRNYLYTVKYFLMEGNGGCGLDWRDLLKSTTPSGMDMSLGRTRDGRIAHPTRVHREHDAEVWADNKSLGKGSGACRVKAFGLARRVFSL
jgi:hypothetical protein